MEYAYKSTIEYETVTIIHLNNLWFLKFLFCSEKKVLE